MLEHGGSNYSAYNLAMLCAYKMEGQEVDVSCIASGDSDKVTEKCSKIQCSNDVSCTTILTTCCVDNTANAPEKCGGFQMGGQGGGFHGHASGGHGGVRGSVNYGN